MLFFLNWKSWLFSFDLNDSKGSLIMTSRMVGPDWGVFYMWNEQSWDMDKYVDGKFCMTSLLDNLGTLPFTISFGIDSTNISFLSLQKERKVK